MEQQIDFMAPEVQVVLPTLLSDKSTGRNIIWATDPPQALSPAITDKSEMTPDQLRQLGFESIRARAGKQAATQQQRTRRRGEVCTPAWVCNKMNNALDADWFGREDVFNTEQPQGWQVREGQVEFPAPKGKTPLWQRYIDSRRLEITCGEAPFLASRYDAATGEMIPVQQRIGILDRKLRVVSEAVEEEKEWLYWAKRAVQATYGYEYQGDNLLLARTNLLLTFVEHLQARWQRRATTRELKTTANIIAWNVWQMDGLKRSIPGGKLHPDTEQLDLFSMFGAAEEQPLMVSCMVRDWRRGSSGTKQRFETIQEGSTSMKFDYVIGNPPYQEQTTSIVPKTNGQVRSKSVFQYFQIEADKLSREASVLIYPGSRWIHRSGKGMMEFGLEQINDVALQRVDFYPNSKDIFGGTIAIADGISIVIKNRKKRVGGFEYVYHNNGKDIRLDVENPGEMLIPLNPSDSAVVNKVDRFVSNYKLSYIHDKILPQKLFGIESDFAESNPDKVREYISDCDVDFTHEIKLFTNDKAGKKGRAKWFVTDRDNVTTNINYIDEWQVVVSSANAGGQKRYNQIEIIDNHSVFGRARVAINSFKTKQEAANFYKYAQTYLIRFMFLMTDEALTSLGKRVPDLMDYSSNNKFVDFSKPLDKQLYSLFELDEEEINYIEKTVNNLRKKKEMA